MSKNKNKTAAPETTGTEPDKKVSKAVTFHHLQRKIDIVRIRKCSLIDFAIDTDAIIDEVSESFDEVEVTNDDKWFIIWVKA